MEHWPTLKYARAVPNLTWRRQKRKHLRRHVKFGTARAHFVVGQCSILLGDANPTATQHLWFRGHSVTWNTARHRNIHACTKFIMVTSKTEVVTSYVTNKIERQFRRPHLCFWWRLFEWNTARLLNMHVLYIVKHGDVETRSSTCKLSW